MYQMYYVTVWVSRKKTETFVVMADRHALITEGGKQMRVFYINNVPVETFEESEIVKLEEA